MFTHRILVSLGLLLGMVAVSAAQAPPDRLTSRPRPEAPAVTTVAAGAEIRTQAGQRRRVRLPDGSVLYANENTAARLDAARTLTLSAGEVYIEAVAAKEAPFVVKAAGRELAGRGASFAVRVASEGPALEVTRGQVQVPGLDRPVRAGEQLVPGTAAPAPAPRASHALPWLRELMAAADVALLPANEHAGGALIAVDPRGQEAKLSLRTYHIDVHIEDGFARTTIDQTYFNHENEQLEGTFYFPLPPDASLSRLAMYVNGDLMEGGMAEREHAREVYETIRYARRDPALLEWVDGTTFKMRVFPLEPRQEKRILLSYSQRVPVLYGKATYRFPAGHTLQLVRDWSVRVRVQGGAERQWSSPSHTLKAQPVGNDLVLEASAKGARIDRDVVLHVSEPERLAADGELVRFASFEQDGARYLLVRHRPRLVVQAAVQRRDWVFLVETSGDGDPLLARAQIEVVRHLLQNAGPDDTFDILAAGTRVQSFAPELLPVTPENVQAALTFLEGIHLIGALDLGQALTEAAALLRKGRDPHLVHLGSGIAAMGERRHDALAAPLPPGTCYVGIGVGKRWARDFMKTTAERTGGLFTQINPDEPLAWRAFELVATLNTPRLLDVTVADRAGKAKFLAFGQALAQGEEIAAVTRVEGSELPTAVVVRGRLDGKPFERLLPVRNASTGAGYLPRTWAKLEIDRLLADTTEDQREKIIALSKAMYVITPYTSLLVLEHEDLYTQYKVDRGRKDHWALYPAPAKIPVVVEPEPGQPDPRDAKARGLRPARQVIQTVILRGFASDAAEHQGKKRLLDRRKLMFERVQDDNERMLTPETLKARSEPTERTEELVALAVAREQDAPARLMRRAGAGMGPGAGTVPAPAPSVPAAAGPAPVDAFAGDVRNGRVLFRGGGAGEPGMPASFFGRSGIARRGTELALKEHITGPALQRRTLQALDETLSREVFFQEKEALPQADTLLYQRPSYTPEANVFADLIAYAPGLNTSIADVEAVLAAEALPSAWDRPGQIDPGVRELLAAAHARGWFSLTLPAEEGQAGYTITFDQDGRFRYERMLAPGLREEVVCDGTALVHAYPQLALAARRDYSRFHRAELAKLVPWFLPPAEELARGADLRLIDKHTVAIVPHSKEIAYRCVHLVFGADERLAERQVVRMPGTEIAARQVLSSDGTVSLLDGNGKELAARKGRLSPAQAPALTADTKDLLVLPLPYRTPAHVRQTLKLPEGQEQQLRLKEALPLFLAEFASGQGARANNVFRQAIHAREQRQLGYYVLLAASGVNLDAENGDVLGEHPDAPLAQYLALHSSPVLRKHASQWAVASIPWQDELLRHLAITHALLQRWQHDKVLTGEPARVQAEKQRALEYIRQHHDSLFGWSLLCLLQDRAAHFPALHKELIDLWPLFEKHAELAYAARYEHARTLCQAERRDEARQRFRSLYEAALKEGVLPAIDADFRMALLGRTAAEEQWSGLLRDTARRLIADKHRLAVLLLARQCWQLDDAPLAGQMLGLALEGLKDEKERAAMTLAGVHFLRETGQFPEADRLLQRLLAEPRQAERPELWRLASEIAGERDRSARAIECLEKTWDLQARHLPEVIDLEAVRADHGRLLAHYQHLADAMVALKLPPPPDFVARVVRAADRWRALDSETAPACQAAAKVLRRLDERDLGWDYLTTPVALKPNEAESWAQLAAELGKHGELELAERAHRAACEAEPTNAQLLWDRAQNLRHAGRDPEARAVFRRIADGSWQPRFQGLQAQARYQLQGQ